MNAATPYETLDVQTSQDGITTVMLNRPRSLNAIDRCMADELVAAFSKLESDPGVAAVVLTGAGGNFSSGGDVRGQGDAQPADVGEAYRSMGRYRRLANALQSFDRPIVAAVDGVAYGAGFSLLLLADVVILGAGARLSMAFGRIGLVPDCGAMYTLPRAVGLQRAKELVFSGREVNAQEAVTLGLALETVASAALLDRAGLLAVSLVGASPLAVSLAKRALDRSLQSDWPAMLDVEAASQALARTSGAHAEAVRRFLERKRPRAPADRKGSSADPAR